MLPQTVGALGSEGLKDMKTCLSVMERQLDMHCTYSG